MSLSTNKCKIRKQLGLFFFACDFAIAIFGSTHLDAIIAHSRDEYLCSSKEISLVLEDDWVPVVIPDNNDKGENVVEGGSREMGVNSNAFPAAKAPPDDSVIDISDEE
jgi:hypothetical protein